MTVSPGPGGCCVHASATQYPPHLRAVSACAASDFAPPLSPSMLSAEYLPSDDPVLEEMSGTWMVLQSPQAQLPQPDEVTFGHRHPVRPAWTVLAQGAGGRSASGLDPRSWASPSTSAPGESCRGTTPQGSLSWSDGSSAAVELSETVLADCKISAIVVASARAYDSFDAQDRLVAFILGSGCLDLVDNLCSLLVPL